MTDATAHIRTVTWDDPLIAAKTVTQMSGLEFLQAIQRGDMPLAPIMKLLGMEPIEAEAGRVVFALDPAEYHYNPIGSVHGGVISTLLDTVMACAIHSLLPAGVAYTTIELHVNFLRPLTIETGKVRCEGESLHVGRSIGTAQGRLTDLKGQLLAHGTTTCLIKRGDQ